MKDFMKISHESLEIPVRVFENRPEVGDKFETKNFIYTISSVKMSPMGMNIGVSLYEVWMDVWNKFECQGDEPEYFFVKVDG